MSRGPAGFLPTAARPGVTRNAHRHYDELGNRTLKSDTSTTSYTYL